MIQSADDLLHALYRRGVKLWPESGQLRFQAPKETLSAEVLHELRARKAEIVQLLEQSQLDKDARIQPRAHDGPVPLSPIQLRFWQWSIESESRASVRWGAFGVRVIGPLSTCHLRRSLEAVVQRHETLRTRIITVGGIPRQKIDAVGEYEFEVIDLSKSPMADLTGELARLAGEFVTEKFDLAIGPLFAAKLFRLSGDEHVLVVALDHMITDGASNVLLSRDIWTLYDQAVQGVPFSLPPMPLQFADYAIWQERTYDMWLKKHAGYWKGRFAGAPRMQLPVDNSSVETASASGALLEVAFGDALSTALRKFAQRERVLLPVVVLTAYVVVLSRWCNESDIVVGVVSNGRYRADLQNMIGFLAHHLPLRIKFEKEDRLIDLLRRVNLEFYAACDHADGGQWPEFITECATEVVFNWTPSYWSKWSVHEPQEVGHGLRLEWYLLESIPLKFYPFFSDSPTGIVGTLTYQPDCFKLGQIEQFCCNMRRFAEELAHHPFARVASILTK